MTVDATLAATITLAAFVGLSFYDGVVVHFFIERLPLRPASQLEHRLHTGRALLFPAILLTFFVRHGPVALGWVLLAMDQVLELWDMAVERRSREHTAGLPSSEYVAHGLLTTLRAAAVTFTVMIDRDSANPASLDALVSALLLGAFIVAAAHVFLATAPGRAALSLKGVAFDLRASDVRPRRDRRSHSPVCRSTSSSERRR